MVAQAVPAAPAAAVAAALLAAPQARADEQYFPLQSYRVGPYAAGGTGFFGGFIDYMNLINIRDGGVNGVKLVWDECETEYAVEKGVECYQRQKSHADIAAWNPLSVGIAYASGPSKAATVKGFTGDTMGVGGAAGPSNPMGSGAKGAAGACWDFSKNAGCAQ